MKKLLFILLLIGGEVYSQCNPVTNLATTSTGNTSASFSWTAAANSQSYSWAVFTYPALVSVTSGATQNTFMTVAGLSPSTQYRLRIRNICNNSTVSILDSLLFTTTSSQLTYTPMTAGGYQFKYLKADSGFHIPFGAVTLGRGSTRPGAIRMSSSDSLIYAWNGVAWNKLVIDSSGIMAALNTKVDSVTLSGDTLYYWINGTSYGRVYTMWGLSGNTVTADTKKLGTLDNFPLRVYTNNLERLTILGDGKVGIGIALPTVLFDVRGDANIGNSASSGNGKLEVYSTDKLMAAYIRNGRTSGTNYGFDAEATGSGATANIAGYFAASGATSNTGVEIASPVAGANNYAIYSSATAKSYFNGSVGLGNTAPTYKLDVTGAGRFTTDFYLPQYTQNTVPYFGASGLVTSVALNATATNKFLRQVSSGVPTFEQVDYASITGTPAAGSYIENQISAPQTSSNAWISGKYQAGSIAPNFDYTVNATGSTSGVVGFSSTNTNSAGYQGLIMSESVTRYGGQFLFGSTYAGNFGGTSVPLANSYNVDTDPNNTKTVNRSLTITNLIGNTGTNIGTRLDATGFKIEAISGLHTTLTTSSVFEIVSTTKGFLLPRMTGVQRAAISSPADGLLAYQTNSNDANKLLGQYSYQNGTWRRLLTDLDSTTLTSGSALTASNGITRTSNNFTWEGALTKHTEITAGGTYSLSLGTTGSRLHNFAVSADNLASLQVLSGSDNNYFNADLKKISIQASNSYGNSGIILDSSAILISAPDDVNITAGNTFSIAKSNSNYIASLGSDANGVLQLNSWSNLTTRNSRIILDSAKINILPSLGDLRIDSLNTGASTDSVLTYNQSTQQVLKQTKAAARGYKVYTALVTQSGTGTPTVTVLQNDLSGTPTWGYTAVGDYTVTLTGEFTSAKTAVIATADAGSTGTLIQGSRTSDNVVRIISANGFNLTNSLMTNSTVEIRVFY